MQKPNWFQITVVALLALILSVNGVMLYQQIQLQQVAIEEAIIEETAEAERQVAIAEIRAEMADIELDVVDVVLGYSDDAYNNPQIDRISEQNLMAIEALHNQNILILRALDLISQVIELSQ